MKTDLRAFINTFEMEDRLWEKKGLGEGFVFQHIMKNEKEDVESIETLFKEYERFYSNKDPKLRIKTPYTFNKHLRKLYPNIKLKIK